MGLSPAVKIPLADGDLGTVQTIARIRKLVHQGMTDQLINRTAIAILHGAGVRQFDFLGEIRAIYEWVRLNIRFTRDIAGVETLRTAREILLIRAGDCDDINSVLLPSLLGTVGHNVRLVTISSHPSAPDVFSHIYCEVELDGRWIPLDSARRDPAFGKGPRYYYRKRIWSLTDSDYRDIRGLGYYRGRMGDESDDGSGGGFDWGGLSTVIASAGTSVANVIRSLNTPGVAYARNPTTGQLVPVAPAGTLSLSSAPGGVVGSAEGSIPNWMLYGLLILGGAMVLKK
jgi:hypothetical protein